MHFKIAVAK